MDFVQIRDFSEFCEQLNELRLRFHKWDSCERTVALYYLMVGLPFPNARFLQHALEQCIASVNTPESQCLERNANDPVFVTSLMTERPQVALSRLQTHLPLLRPGNKEAAECYLMAIRRVITDSVSPPYKIYNDCVEIMSYVFVHPAFDKEDKKSFKQLLKQVLSRVSPENFIHSPVNEQSSDESVSPNPEPVNFLSMQQENARLGRRSNSLTPAQTSSHESLTMGPSPSIWSSQENLALPQQPKPRSYSLSHDKTTLPLNVPTLTSSSSETRLQDLQTMSNLPIMKGVVFWLKSLRLHKYSWVFTNLTYDQMLNLTEENLQAMGITKGARHKILLSIAKLKERSIMLSELEVEVMNGGDLLGALKKLKGILQSPLQVTSGEDLPSQFVKVMGKVCTQLLMLRQPADECLSLFAGLCERAETLDSFTGEQKRRLTLWKSQLARGNHIPPYVHNKQQSANNYRHQTNPTGQFFTPTGSCYSQIYTQKSSSYPNVQNNSAIGSHRHSISSTTVNNQQKQQQSNNTNNQTASNNIQQFQQNDIQNSHFKITNHQQQHVRFKDTEPQPHQLMTTINISAMSAAAAAAVNNCVIAGGGHQEISKSRSSDIESSLESLCLQMMEHALGP